MAEREEVLIEHEKVSAEHEKTAAVEVQAKEAESRMKMEQAEDESRDRIRKAERASAEGIQKTEEDSMVKIREDKVTLELQEQELGIRERMLDSKTTRLNSGVEELGSEKARLSQEARRVSEVNDQTMELLRYNDIHRSSLEACVTIMDPTEHTMDSPILEAEYFELRCTTVWVGLGFTFFNRAHLGSGYRLGWVINWVLFLIVIKTIYLLLYNYHNYWVVLG